jgi:type III secretion system FlhB-like substrate exporter
MRMEKFEVKQEYKDTEGDPHIKSKRRQTAQEIAYQDGPAATKKARAVITNPTHIAVALEYKVEEEPAPKIATMGLDLVAEEIIKVALGNNIPIMRNVELAHTLYYKSKIGDYIPEETYEAVAEILKWIARLEETKEAEKVEEIFKTMKDSIRRFSNSLGSSRALKIITDSSDIVLAFFVVVIIMMIIIPVPPEVLDGLIGINLTVSFALLMVALYITKAVHLSVFPSILLITTLFRLGIEISATKQILLHANAGQVIFAFGNFVVGGNFIVGGIVFLIITIVQFIVVTKGAERVAEVAARFTLDAMPGKQMSIDADMRSGIIDANQARQLRLSLQKESQLYGAMDGAMKFVKGDVIAGIVIAVINIIGGLVIGVFTHNMSALQAARTYTLLSIGGGLVSQIPSLLISLTAGIVTTRVSSDREETNLGREISSQLLSHPKAIILAAIITFLMSLVSAFPTVLFLSLSAGLTGLGLNSYFKQRKLQLAAAAGGRGALPS